MVSAGRRLPFSTLCRRHVRFLAAAFMFGLCAPAPAASSIDVQRDGAAFSVQASADIAASPSVVWNTITDYERLREFVPDVERSRVLARDGNRLTVEHFGRFHLFFFSRPVWVRLAVEHQPFERVIARSEAGLVDGEEPTLRSFFGRYTLTVIDSAGRAGVRLHYDARFELAEGLPPLVGPLLGTAIVRATMHDQFEAMLREIERRQAARPPVGKAQ